MLALKFQSVLASCIHKVQPTPWVFKIGANIDGIYVLALKFQSVLASWIISMLTRVWHCDHISRRTYRKHSTPVTDTDDTDEEDAVGGLGIFSHGRLCLTHQHWVDQAVIAGGFNVHCTQAAESSHKVNMHLMSARARHLDANYTQSRMLTYLRWYEVFETLHDKPIPMSRQTKTGVSALLRIPSLDRGLRQTWPFATVGFQSTFLHGQVRVSGGEFLDLLCNRFGFTQARSSYLKTWEFAFCHLTEIHKRRL